MTLLFLLKFDFYINIIIVNEKGSVELENILYQENNSEIQIFI
jgi:hypothetical protein